MLVLSRREAAAPEQHTVEYPQKDQHDPEELDRHAAVRGVLPVWSIMRQMSDSCLNLQSSSMT